MTTSTDDKNFRLSTDFRAVRYQAELTLKPSDKRFSGRMQVEVFHAQPTQECVLHAISLNVSNVCFVASGKNHAAKAVVLKPASETVVFSFDEMLPEGKGTLSFDWEGAYSPGLRGLYAAGPLTSTQFEAAEARRCFPCLDEPSFKARWKISIRAPRGHVTLSNGRALESVDEGETVLTHFEETELLSSYLLALTSGPLASCREETVDGIALRTWATPDKVHLTAFGQEVAREVLPRLREYFGLPYGFGKMDQAAVPDFEAGAMENAGLVIYREILLLVDKARAPLSVQKRVAEVITHELAHQWFGNWVTMVWWDDLWLNEAFATWMAYKIVDDWKPEWRLWVDFDAGKASAMALDALRSTHPIRCDVLNAGEAGENFDVITYEKGGAVLRMLEGYLGETVFRDGIRRYMKKHALANAMADDLWAALAEASGQPVGELAHAWIGKSGFPLISVTQQGRTVKLSQRRFYSEPGVSSDDVWPVPLVLRYEDDDGLHEHRVLLRQASDEVQVPGQGAIRWLCANADNRGFYRVLYSPEGLSALAQHRKALFSSEKIALISDVWALVRANIVSIDAFLSLVDAFGEEDDYAVIDELVARLSVVSHRLLDESSRPAFQAFLQKKFGLAFRTLGWDSGPEETDARRLLRASLLKAVGLLGKDADVMAEAESRLLRVLAHDAKALPNDVLDAATILAARHEKSLSFEAMVKAFVEAVDPAAKRRFLNGLTAFESPSSIQRAQDMLFSETLPMQEVSGHVAGLMANPKGRVSTWAMLQAKWPEVLARTGGGQGLLKRVVESVGALVTREEFEQAQKLFAEKPVEQAKKAIEQTLERLSQDVAFRERVLKPLSVELMKRG